MNIFDKTRYLRALLYLTPVGLGLIIFSIKSLLIDVNDLQKVSGIVQNISFIKTPFEFRNQQFLSDAISIKLKNSRVEYITSISNHIEVININLNNEDKITIWVNNERNKNEIAQIEKEGVIVIPYEKDNGMAWGLLITGILTSVIAIGYLIKYPEDLLGKKTPS